MGGSNSKRPLPGETPVAFMYRNDQGFYVEPYVSNLAGWSEKMTPQIDTPYPRDGSFSDDGIDLAKSMVKEGWGDPKWDYKYMLKAYAVWKDFKKVWDEGPEKKQVLAYVAKQGLSEKPPSYSTFCQPETLPSAPVSQTTCSVPTPFDRAHSAKRVKALDLVKRQSNCHRLKQMRVAHLRIRWFGFGPVIT